MKTCPGLIDSGVPDGLALAAVQILPSAISTTSAAATICDFGAESSRPASSLPTLQPRPVTRPEARLATGLPATALTGLDSHQLDSFERFLSAHIDVLLPHGLAWRDEIRYSRFDIRHLQYLVLHSRDGHSLNCGPPGPVTFSVLSGSEIHYPRAVKSGVEFRPGCLEGSRDEAGTGV